MKSAKKRRKRMTVKMLNSTSYPKTRRLIDDMTIEMYQGITSGLLHDDSPLQIGYDIKDTWEVVALSLYDNEQLTHREFLTCITQICKMLELAYKSLGLEFGTEYLLN